MTFSQYHTFVPLHEMFRQAQSVRLPGHTRLLHCWRRRMRGTHLRAVKLTAFPNLQNIHDVSKAMVTLPRHNAHIRKPSLVKVNRR